MSTDILTQQDIHSFVNTTPDNRREVINEKLNVILKPTRGQIDHLPRCKPSLYRSLSTDLPENCCLGQKYQQVVDKTETGGCFDKEHLPEITDLDSLLDALCEVMIRFDTCPKDYMKEDYYSLITTLSNSLIHLYLATNKIETEYAKIEELIGGGDFSKFAIREQVDKQFAELTDILNSHISDTNNPHQVTKEQVGLGEVDNTSDLDKPISIACAEALGGKEDKFNKVTQISEGSTDEEYPSAKCLYSTIQNLPHPVAPEQDKDIITVNQYSDLVELEEPSTEVIYLVKAENSLYSYDGSTFNLITEDDTLYISGNTFENILTNLGNIVEAGEKKVCTLLRINNQDRFKKESWTYSVEHVNSGNSLSYTQVLKNGDGYYKRTGYITTEMEKIKWYPWDSRVYAYKSDIGNGSLQLKMNGAPYKSGRLDDAGEIVWGANSKNNCVLDFDNAAFMPDFAWWQTYHANIGANVLMTGQYTVPFVKRKDGKRMLFEVGFVRAKKISDTVHETPADKLGTLHLPERCTTIYFYTPLSTATFTFTLTHLGEQVTIVPAMNKTMGIFSIPNGWAGQTVDVGVKIEGIFGKCCKNIHLYATDEEVLSSNVHTYWNYGIKQTRRYNEWEHLQRYGNKFWLVRWNAEDKRWRLLPYRQGTVRVRRHFLECKISARERTFETPAYYTDDYGNTFEYKPVHFIDRDSYREFSVQTISPKKDDGIYPAFVRALTNNRSHRRKFMWLTNIGNDDAHHQRAGFRLRPSEMPVWPSGYDLPDGKRYGYLDVMYADMQYKLNRIHSNTGWNGERCNHRIRRRPLIKSLCAHWRKHNYIEEYNGPYGFTGGIKCHGAEQIPGRWSFIGYVKPPRVQF